MKSTHGLILELKSDGWFVRNEVSKTEHGESFRSIMITDSVGKTMHKVDEAVSLKDLKNLTKIYQNILEYYFK